MEILPIFLICAFFVVIALRGLMSGVFTLRGGQRLERRSNPVGFWLVGGFALFVPVVIASVWFYALTHGLIGQSDGVEKIDPLPTSAPQQDS